MAINTGRGKGRLTFTDTIADKSSEQAILRRLDAVQFAASGMLLAGNYNEWKNRAINNPESTELALFNDSVALAATANAGTNVIDFGATDAAIPPLAAVAGVVLAIRVTATADAFITHSAGIIGTDAGTIALTNALPFQVGTSSVVDVYAGAAGDSNIETPLDLIR